MTSDANDRKLMLLGWAFHLGGLATLVLGGVVYQVAYAGMLAQQRNGNLDEIARLETLLHTEQNIGRDYKRLKAELSRLETSAEAARQRIPETPQESEFLAQISEVARDKGLEIKNFTRGAVTVLDTHSQLQIRLSGEGDYASICGFFEELAGFPRVATVSQLNLTVPADASVYPLDMTLTLYFGARSPQGGKRG